MSGQAANGSSPRRSGLSIVEVVLAAVSTLLVGGTGLVYAWFRYLAGPPEGFAVTHPWEPSTQHLHVLAAPLLVFAVGLLWRAHVIASWKRNGASRRRSGVVIALASFPMIASGYFLQIAVDAGWRRAWGVLHTGGSLVWLASSLIHLLARRSLGAPAAAVDLAAVGPAAPDCEIG